MSDAIGAMLLVAAIVPWSLVALGALAWVRRRPPVRSIDGVRIVQMLRRRS